MSKLELIDWHLNPRPETPDFTAMMERTNRRGFMGMTAAAAGVLTFLNGSSASAATTASPSLGFKAVPASSADTIVVPEGYEWSRLISWGDPILPGGVPFDEGSRGTGATQALAMGDNNDGMSFFPIDDTRGVIAVNNEYTNIEWLYPSGKPETADDVLKGQNAHGVAIFEVVQRNGRWQLDANGQRNRRITANTPMTLTGPVAGTDAVKTAADPSGTRVLGTINNCANGMTPWGTFLTCEENFNGLFGASGEYTPSAEQKRYGLNQKDWGYGWPQYDKRFDLSQEPNEANRFGYVVEIDPMNPNSTPKKRTALGRFKHENAEVVINKDGRVVVYMGDDERGEHIYKFVSAAKYDPSNQRANRDLLENGRLFVARFEAKEGQMKGVGKWVELAPGKNGLSAANGFATMADVLVNTRLAATVVGATTMDRPEWVAAHPNGRDVYVTLTNNKYRGVRPNQPVDGANPREKNPYGHIMRWAPTGGDHLAEGFTWDLFALAGNPVVHRRGLLGGTPNINAGNMFNSPDGLAFDVDGRMWIQSDGNYSNKGDFEGMGNNQMLAANPVTGEIKRFLTGPVACEITGLSFSPDRKTMFVGVQHPGEDKKPSTFPLGGVPRSTIIAIWRKDGGVVGA
jgi:secreted PhoX family phosphatase